ncbi:hypothetical protein JL721_9206 [Aureococcus anophagefferens]|nr:hypothetical protein JL721_9206 [Aureococcus anophagefferens]
MMRSRAALRPLRRALDAPQREIGTLILLRHGQSIWNGTTATFTGWCDVALTPRGRSQAIEAGELLGERGYGSKITDVFTSELERAYETAALAMTAIEQHGGHRNPRTVRDPRLNERHYGCVQGVCKGDAMLLSYFGEAQARVLACYEDCVKPALFAGPDRTVLLVAHSNTLRGLMASIDGVPDADVPSLHVPNSVPILYRFDETSRELVSRKYAPLEKGSAAGSHARWLLSSRNLIRLRSALAPGGVLTRALFDALDENGDRMLTADEIKLGVRKLLGDDQGSKRVIQRRFNVSDDVAVAAIVRRIVRHLNMKDDAVCTLADFEASAAHIAHEILHEAKVPARPPPPDDVDLPWGKVQPIHQRDGGDDRSAYG